MVNTLSVSLSLTVGVHTFFSRHTQKFKDVVSGAAVDVTSLYTGTRYPVLHCEREGTKYGMSVHVSLCEEADENGSMVFLPRQYATTITDEDISTINSHAIQYYLTYKRKSATSNRPMLQMDV